MDAVASSADIAVWLLQPPHQTWPGTEGLQALQPLQRRHAAQAQQEVGGTHLDGWQAGESGRLKGAQACYQHCKHDCGWQWKHDKLQGP